MMMDPTTVLLSFYQLCCSDVEQVLFFFSFFFERQLIWCDGFSFFFLTPSPHATPHPFGPVPLFYATIVPDFLFLLPRVLVS